MKKFTVLTICMAICLWALPLAADDDLPIIDLASYQLQQLGGETIEEHGLADLKLVKLRGKINHFGRDINGQYIKYEATVPDVQIWIAEYPETEELEIESDDTGWWTAWVLKLEGVDVDISIVYEKEGWITTKSNVITVTDEDDTDLAIQYIDPTYYTYTIKPAIERDLSAIPDFPGLLNAMVVTVGKKWASMHNPLLPHGDPGATVSMTPLAPAIGPIYFNKHVYPDPTIAATSVDGGVTWINVPTGTYAVTAHKPGVNYETVHFVIAESDAEAGVVLYIASCPDSVEGDNDSGPGLP